MPNGRKRETATTRKNKFAFFALYGYTITKVWTLRILENNIVLVILSVPNNVDSSRLCRETRFPNLNRLSSGENLQKRRTESL